MPICSCPECQNASEVPSSYFGQNVRCGKCGQRFVATWELDLSDISSNVTTKRSVPDAANHAGDEVTTRAGDGPHGSKFGYGCLTGIFVAVVIMAIVYYADQVQLPYRKVVTLDDKSGNRMEIFVPIADHDITSLRSLCRKHGSREKVGGFYLIVVFDEERNVLAPTTPTLSASYGMMNRSDIRACQHIIAEFVYNRHNGFSQLTTYQKNSWESKGVSEKVSW